MKRYAAWCRRQGSTAQCSPGLMVLGIVAVACVVAWVYRALIIQTLIDVAIAVGIVCSIAVAVAITINALKWRRVHAAEMQERLERAHLAADYDEPVDEHDPVLDHEVREHTEPVGLYDRPVPREPAVDRPVPVLLDAELDEDLLNLTGR